MSKQERQRHREIFAMWWHGSNNDKHRPRRMKAHGRQVMPSQDYPGLRYRIGKHAGARA